MGRVESVDVREEEGRGRAGSESTSRISTVAAFCWIRVTRARTMESTIGNVLFFVFRRVTALVVSEEVCGPLGVECGGLLPAAVMAA